jgi:hypothetical protein
MYIMDTPISYINKLYDNLSFFELHFQSVLLVLLVSIIVILVSTASRILSKSNVLKTNWDAERCKPNIMPFAGLINKPIGQTIAEYTLSNFNYCVSNILNTGFKKASFSYDLAGATNGLLDSSIDVDMSFNMTTNIFSDIQNNVSNTFSAIQNKFANSMVPVQQALFAVQDMFQRMQAVFIAGVYTSLGNSLMLKSLISQMLRAVSKIFYLLLIIITALFIIPGTQGLAIATTAIAMPLLVTTAAINLSMGKAFGVAPGKLPSIRKCFDKYTLLKMNDGTYTQIDQIKVGDVLMNSNVVTATIILDSKHAKMYNVNGIIVSGFHKIKHKNEWVSVSKYPYRREMHTYIESHIYCINTSNKIINIGDFEFLDWDEIYNSKHNFHLDKILNYRMDGLTTITNTHNIHRVLDGGFCENTPIRLFNKRVVSIKDIVAGDKLVNGAIVYGVVQIKSDDLTICEYNLGQKINVFKGGPNLIFLDSNEKIHTTLDTKDILKNPTHNIIQTPRSNTPLFHLLTDVQTFYVGGIKFKDYNSLIDTILANIIC